MTKRMLVDASHPDEIRIAVVQDQELIDLEIESAARAQIKGNIYVGRVVRVEPSLQAAFIDFNGGRQGFLSVNDIHPKYYPEEKEGKNNSERGKSSRRGRRRGSRRGGRGGGHEADSDQSQEQTIEGQAVDAKAEMPSEGVASQQEQPTGSVVSGQSDAAPSGAPQEDEAKTDQQASVASAEKPTQEIPETITGDRPPAKKTFTKVEPPIEEAEALYAATVASSASPMEAAEALFGGASTKQETAGKPAERSDDAAREEAKTRKSDATAEDGDTKPPPKAQAAGWPSGESKLNLNADGELESVQTPDSNLLDASESVESDIPQTDGAESPATESAGDHEVQATDLNDAASVKAKETDSEQVDSDGGAEASDLEDVESDEAEASEESCQRRGRGSRRHGRKRGRKGESQNGDEEGNGDADLPFSRPPPRRRNVPIQKILQRNQTILVQVVKEARGNKGASLTTNISLAGRYIVLLPEHPYGGGISRKISDQKQRKELKNIPWICRKSRA